MSYISANPYKFKDDVGTYTLTSEQKVALNNSAMIRVGFKLLFKEYDYTTTTTKTGETTSVDSSTGIATKKTTYKDVIAYKDTFHFESDDYTLTFTTTSYTLAKK